MCWVSFRYPWMVSDSLSAVLFLPFRAGYVFLIPVMAEGCAFCLLGIVFDTRGGGVRLFAYVVVPPSCCWVLFLIPVMADGCAFCVLGIVFDTRGDGE